MSDGYIYVVSDGGPELKIGKTTRTVGKRMKDGQTFNPRELRALHSWWTADVDVAERAMHDLLAHRRRRGEWFAVSEEAVVKAWAAVSDWSGLRLRWAIRWAMARRRARSVVGFGRHVFALVGVAMTAIVVAGILSETFL